jgi:hypothetical protein
MISGFAVYYCNWRIALVYSHMDTPYENMTIAQTDIRTKLVRLLSAGLAASTNHGIIS